MPDCEPEVDAPPLVMSDDEAPVLPDVPEPLDVPPAPVEEEAPVVPDVPDELEAPPRPVEGDGEPEAESLDEPKLEPLDVLPLVPNGELAELVEDGPREPCAEPVVAPIPEAEPEAEPLAVGPLVLQAANVNAHVMGTNHFFITYSFLVKAA